MTEVATAPPPIEMPNIELNRAQLRPNIRAYADNLTAQIGQGIQDAGVKNYEEFEDGIRTGAIPLDRARDLIPLALRLSGITETGHVEVLILPFEIGSWKANSRGDVFACSRNDNGVDIYQGSKKIFELPLTTMSPDLYPTNESLYIKKQEGDGGVYKVTAVGSELLFKGEPSTGRLSTIMDGDSETVYSGLHLGRNLHKILRNDEEVYEGYTGNWTSGKDGNLYIGTSEGFPNNPLQGPHKLLRIKKGEKEVETIFTSSEDILVDTGIFLQTNDKGEVFLNQQGLGGLSPTLITKISPDGLSEVVYNPDPKTTLVRWEAIGDDLFVVEAERDQTGTVDMQKKRILKNGVEIAKGDVSFIGASEGNIFYKRNEDGKARIFKNDTELITLPDDELKLEVSGGHVFAIPKETPSRPRLHLYRDGVDISDTLRTRAVIVDGNAYINSWKLVGGEFGTGTVRNVDTVVKIPKGSTEAEELLEGENIGQIKQFFGKVYVQIYDGNGGSSIQLID